MNDSHIHVKVKKVVRQVGILGVRVVDIGKACSHYNPKVQMTGLVEKRLAFQGVRGSIGLVPGEVAERLKALPC